MNKKKHKTVLFIASMITTAFFTSCSLKEQDSAGSAMGIQDNTISDTVKEDTGKSIENEEMPKEEKDVETPKFINNLLDLDEMDSRKELIALGWFGEEQEDEYLQLIVPQYHAYNSSSGCSVMDSGNRLLIAIVNQTSNMEKRAKGNSLEDVMEVTEEVYQEEIITSLNNGYGYKEIMFDIQEEITVNGLDLNHFTGYLVGTYSSGEETGLTYYVEGYTYVHTNQVPVLIIGTVLWDNEGEYWKDLENGVGELEEIKEELAHNLHEMIKTIELKED